MAWVPDLVVRDGADEMALAWAQEGWEGEVLSSSLLGWAGGDYGGFWRRVVDGMMLGDGKAMGMLSCLWGLDNGWILWWPRGGTLDGFEDIFLSLVELVRRVWGRAAAPAAARNPIEAGAG